MSAYGTGANVFAMILAIAQAQRDEQLRALSARRLKRHERFMCQRVRTNWKRQRRAVTPIEVTA